MNILHVRYSDPQAPALFEKSIRETGFAVLTEHPIPIDLIQTTFSEWEKFFASEKKINYKFDIKSQAGYFRFAQRLQKIIRSVILKNFITTIPIEVNCLKEQLTPHLICINA